MATRIYLPSSGTAPVTPQTWNFPYQASTTYTLPGRLTKSNTSHVQISTATGTVSPRYTGVMRYVIGRLTNNQISGTVNLVMRCYENNTGANATLGIAVKIIKPDGSDRAVLLNYTASDSATSPYEFTTSWSSRRAYNESEQRPIPLTAQTPQWGDYLVIEIGFRSATTTNRTVGHTIGDNNSNDLPDTDGDTNDYDPWVEFSADIQWVEDKSGTASISGSGALSAGGQKGAKVAASCSGAGLFTASQTKSGFGISQISGIGDISSAGLKGALDSGYISSSGLIEIAGEKEGFDALYLSGSGKLNVIGEKEEAFQGKCLENGYWNKLYWPLAYWQDNYWPEYFGGPVTIPIFMYYYKKLRG